MQLVLLKTAGRRALVQKHQLGQMTAEVIPASDIERATGVGVGIVALASAALLASLVMDYFRLRDGNKTERIAIAGGYVATLAGAGASMRGSHKLGEVLGAAGALSDAYGAFLQYQRDVHPTLNVLSAMLDALQVGATVADVASSSPGYLAGYETSNDMQLAAGPESDEINPVVDPFTSVLDLDQ